MTENKNVATYTRIKPLGDNENKADGIIEVKGRRRISISTDNKQSTYTFTKVFNTKHTTQKLFEEAVQPLLDHKILNGTNSIFMVYGQSGTGKSFTLIGERNHVGILSMSLQYLLRKTDKVKRIDIAAIEAYGVIAAKIGFYDLASQLTIKQNKASKRFDPYSSKNTPSKRSDPYSAKFIQITQDNCLQITSELQAVSHMAPTLKNHRSSRGHTAYFVRVKISKQDVYFICTDLAGSEGQSALGSKEQFVSGLKVAVSKGELNKKVLKSTSDMKEMYKTRRLEAGCINNGLVQVKNIFNELAKQKTTNARGCGLRKILSSFISLQSAYAILFTLETSSTSLQTTKDTLKFAKQTKCVNAAVRKAKIIADIHEKLTESKQDEQQTLETIKKLKSKKKSQIASNWKHNSNTLTRQKKLEKEITKLKKRIKELEKQNRRIPELEKRINTSQKHNSSLLRQNSTLCHTNKTLANQADGKAKADLSELKETVEELKTNVDELNMRIGDIERRRSEYEKRLCIKLLTPSGRLKLQQELKEICQDVYNELFYNTVAKRVDMMFFDARIIISDFVKHEKAVHNKIVQGVKVATGVIKQLAKGTGIPFLSTVIGLAVSGADKFYDITVLQPSAQCCLDFQRALGVDAANFATLFALNITKKSLEQIALLKKSNKRKEKIKKEIRCKAIKYSTYLIKMICKGAGKTIYRHCGSNCSYLDILAVLTIQSTGKNHQLQSYESIKQFLSNVGSSERKQLIVSYFQEVESSVGILDVVSNGVKEMVTKI